MLAVTARPDSWYLVALASASGSSAKEERGQEESLPFLPSSVQGIKCRSALEMQGTLGNAAARSVAAVSCAVWKVQMWGTLGLCSMWIYHVPRKCCPAPLVSGSAQQAAPIMRALVPCFLKL